VCFSRPPPPPPPPPPPLHPPLGRATSGRPWSVEACHDDCRGSVSPAIRHAPRPPISGECGPPTWTCPPSDSRPAVQGCGRPAPILILKTLVRKRSARDWRRYTGSRIQRGPVYPTPGAASGPAAPCDTPSVVEASRPWCPSASFRPALEIADQRFGRRAVRRRGGIGQPTVVARAAPAPALTPPTSDRRRRIECADMLPAQAAPAPGDRGTRSAPVGSPGAVIGRPDQAHAAPAVVGSVSRVDNVIGELSPRRTMGC